MSKSRIVVITGVSRITIDALTYSIDVTFLWPALVL